MATRAELDELISTAAAEPQSASVDGQSATNRPLKELREIRDEVAASALAAAGSSPFDMIYRAKGGPPGA